MYLPLYEEIKSTQIGVDDNAKIEADTNPSSNKIIVYGSSITQEASASRPELAYPSQLSRKTGSNFINLGLRAMENWSFL